MIKEAIVKIVNKEDLTYDEAYTVMNEIMSGETTATQNAAFLAALSTKSARAHDIRMNCFPSSFSKYLVFKNLIPVPKTPLGSY